MANSSELVWRGSPALAWDLLYLLLYLFLLSLFYLLNLHVPTSLPTPDPLAHMLSPPEVTPFSVASSEKYYEASSLCARSLSLKHKKKKKQNLAKPLFSQNVTSIKAITWESAKTICQEPFGSPETRWVFLSTAITDISLPEFSQSINKNTELNRNLIAWRYYHSDFGLSLVGSKEFDDLALEQISKWGPFVTHLFTIAFLTICEMSSFAKYQTTICRFWS